MKLAKVTVVHKGGPANELTNYRPISVLPVFAKVAEQVINKRFVRFLTAQNIIADEQFGFRKDRSAETALLGIKEKILNNIEEKAHTLGIFLDFRKAFDCVQHDVLIRKLPLYGFRGVSLTLIESYLTSREQFTVINAAASHVKTIKYGVPQGSILGPVLFILYLNDIVNIPGSENLVLYADDTNVFFSGIDPYALERKANYWLTGLSTWLKLNKMQLNTSKTKYILFRAKGVKAPDNLNLNFENTQLKQCSQIRFLGVLFQENLSWNSHVDQLRSDLCRAVGILNKLRYLPASIKRQIYYSLIHSRLSYCSLVWLTTTKTNRDSLFAIQKRALRAIGKIQLLRSCWPLFRSYGILEISKLHTYKLCLEILRQYKLDKITFETTYHTKLSTYELRKQCMETPRVRTNYGFQRLGWQIPDLINQYPIILDTVRNTPSIRKYKMLIKAMLINEP